MSNNSAGKYQAAWAASKKAKFWTWLSAGIAAGVWLLYILFFVVLGIAGVAAGGSGSP